MRLTRTRSALAQPPAVGARARPWPALGLLYVSATSQASLYLLKGDTPSYNSPVRQVYDTTSLSRKWETQAKGMLLSSGGRTGVWTWGIWLQDISC